MIAKTKFNRRTFTERVAKHDAFENEIMEVIRQYTDRKHLPDRRVSFGGVPVSLDVKTNVFVEKNAHDEYFQLWFTHEPVAIVFRDGGGEKRADWIANLSWSGSFPASSKSTCGDDYYRIAGGRSLEDWLEHASAEARELIAGWLISIDKEM